MTTLTPTRLAQMPRVNLLPPEIAAAAKLKRLKLILGLLVLAAMVLVVLGYLFASSSIGGAEESLADAQADGAQLQADVATYAEVPQVLAEVDTAQANLETAMTPEIRWSFYLNDLSLTIPRSTRLVTMTAINDAAAAQLAGALCDNGPGGDAARTGVDGLHRVHGKVDRLRRSRGMAAVVWHGRRVTWSLRVQNVTKADAADSQGTYYDVESNTQLSVEASSGRYLEIANGE